MAGKRIEFVRTGLTINNRVYLAGEVVDIPEGFVPQSPEEQLEYYGKTFYTETSKPLTNPTAFRPMPELEEPEWRPQIAATRTDGSTEVGGGSVSFTPTTTKGVVPRSALPDVPVLDGKKSKAVKESDSELGEDTSSNDDSGKTRPTLKLKRSSKVTEESEPIRKKVGKKKRGVLAKATKLPD